MAIGLDFKSAVFTFIVVFLHRIKGSTAWEYCQNGSAQN